MAPNLTVLYYKATHPREWNIFQKRDKKQLSLHHYNSPIPGIYSVDPKHGRVLRYIKGNLRRMAGEVMYDDLFVSKSNRVRTFALEGPGPGSSGCEGEERGVSHALDLRGENSRDFVMRRDDEDRDTGGMSAFPKVPADDFELFTHKETQAPTTRFRSYSTKADPSDNVIRVDEIERRWSPTPSSSNYSSNYSNGPPSATSRSRTSDTAPLLSGPSNSLDSIPSPYTQNNHPSIDLDGYLELRHPLPVHFNHLTNRWMFEGETQLRKEICAISVTKHQEFFLLDDACSYILTGRAPSTKGIDMMKKLRLSRVDKKTLWVWDPEMGFMRKQNKREVAETRIRLSRCEGAVFGDGESDRDWYSDVHDYWAAGVRMKERVELERLQLERV